MLRKNFFLAPFLSSKFIRPFSTYPMNVPSIDLSEFVQFKVISDFTSEKASKKFDLILYLPHGETRINFDMIYQYFPNVKLLDPVAVEKFCYMDADIGTRELAEVMAQNLSDRGMSVAIVDIMVPRSIVDFNRHFELSMPPLWLNETFADTFSAVHEKIQEYFSNATHVFHIHTMASNDRTSLWWPEAVAIDSISSTFTLEKVLEYAATAYNGPPRVINILTGDKHGHVYVNEEITQRLELHLSREGYTFGRNVTYAFEPCYPSSKWVLKYPASSLDITKATIATDDTKDLLNPGLIQVSDDAVKRLGNTLSNAYFEYLMK